ncbi:RsfA family transcriptional regulator [Alicyclobacillus dauci]|uniref:RsfA family transcriptional regulator n=1 Tax=Alicyclobacillus dauci TaxID=1475485 RepID=A0ABY6Z1W2_9BACL|nr:RsfA family transcriptional regulator [Alicyclobacillus dauci]WAH36583.1 RsfA family transcriptional regulator [Alicyclobacillus dauci]
MQTVEKWASRSDAWTPDDDTRLADLVLQHIRSGSTQLKAFEEAASLLGRTPAACGYRWNGVVRKDYRTEIAAAKQARKNAGSIVVATIVSESPSTETIDTSATSESMKDVIEFLQTYDAQYQKLRTYLTQIEKEKHALAAQVESLQEQLSSQQTTIEKSVSPEQLEEDSRTLFAIMERARRLLGDSNRAHSDS